MTLIAEEASPKRKRNGAAPAPTNGAGPHAEPRPALPRPRAQKWLQPIARGLDSERLLVATKSGFLIAINGLMLAVTAHALYGADLSARAAPLLPLALTNLLSLAFAVVSAQLPEAPSTLERLWAKADAEYGQALADVFQSKQRVAEAFAEGLHAHGAVLERSRKYLRTAYHVLLGGLVLSAATFALCLLFGAVG